MKCPKCSSTNNQVVNSRPFNNGESIRRRRECLICDDRWTTYEHTMDYEAVEKILADHKRKIDCLAKTILAAQKMFEGA